MTTEKNRQNRKDKTLQELRTSIIRVIDHLKHECYFFEEGEIPHDHLSSHIEQLVNWCNAQFEIDNDDKGHNGWTNYETWLVAVWLDNDYGVHDYWRGRAQEIVECLTSEAENFLDRMKGAEIVLARELKAELEPDTQNLKGLYSDLLTAAFANVNWQEIASGFITAID